MSICRLCFNKCSGSFVPFIFGIFQNPFPCCIRKAKLMGFSRTFWARLASSTDSNAALLSCFGQSRHLHHTTTPVNTIPKSTPANRVVKLGIVHSVLISLCSENAVAAVNDSFPNFVTLDCGHTICYICGKQGRFSSPLICSGLPLTLARLSAVLPGLFASLEGFCYRD